MQVLQNISQHFLVFLHCSQETDIRILGQRQGLLLLWPFFHQPATQKAIKIVNKKDQKLISNKGKMVLQMKGLDEKTAIPN
jgi:hypothetical protein